MRRFVLVILLLLIAGGSAFADAQKDMYSIPCSTLWPAVKYIVRNSGYYAIVLIDNTEMAAPSLLVWAKGCASSRSS